MKKTDNRLISDIEINESFGAKKAKRNNKKIFLVLLIVLISVAAIYFIVCTGLYFFEPSYYYKESDLSEKTFSFDLYDKYNINDFPDNYIYRLTAADVKKDEKSGSKFVKNTVLVTTNGKINDMKKLCDDFDIQLVGCISQMNLCQFMSNTDLDLDGLLALCDKLKELNYISNAIPDYFEETPSAEETTDSTDYSPVFYFGKDYLNAEFLFNDNIMCKNAKIGMIDAPLSDNVGFINVGNKDEYSYDKFKSQIGVGLDHSSHVASVCSATRQPLYIGTCPGASVYSYNGVNNSLSFWLACLNDMIVTKKVDAINISMGYNSYLTIAASQGNENAIDFIDSEAALVSDCLSSLLDRNFDFLICCAAGNTNNDYVYKDNKAYFGYETKDILSKLDKFHIFSVKTGHSLAKYSLFLSDIYDEKVRSHIIVVGSTNKNNEYSSFSCIGDRVDICTIGESIAGAMRNGKTIYLSGTSMSAPIVTGTAALLHSKNPTKNGAEIKSMIVDNSHGSVDIDGENSCGIIDIQKSFDCQ